MAGSGNRWRRGRATEDRSPYPASQASRSGPASIVAATRPNHGQTRSVGLGRRDIGLRAVREGRLRPNLRVTVRSCGWRVRGNVPSVFNESWPWKRDLGEAAERLEIAAATPNLGLPDYDDPAFDYDTEVEAFYQVERDVMAGCFAVRRLIGMPSKVTKRARTTKAAVTQFPLIAGARAPDTFDALGELDMYMLESPTPVVVTANELCNLFVHSLIFRFAWTVDDLSWGEYWALNEDDPRIDGPVKLAGFLVATDKSSSGHVTLVGLDEIVRVFRILAEDEVTQLVSRRDPAGRRHFTAS